MQENSEALHLSRQMCGGKNCSSYHATFKYLIHLILRYLAVRLAAKVAAGCALHRQCCLINRSLGYFRTIRNAHTLLSSWRTGISSLMCILKHSIVK